MQPLASLFVALVTFAQTVVPGTKVDQLLTLNPLKSSQAVLSETDTTTSSALSPRKEQIKARIDKRLEERQTTIAEFREKHQETKEDRQEKRAEFKEKLAEIKDSRKQAIVEKIDVNLATLNSKWVNHWNEVLERLSALIVKIETRTESAKAEGKDTTDIELAITTAKAAIENAQTVVNTQGEKTYTITITSETGLGQDVKTTINEFHNDIKNTKDAVETARQAIKEIVILLKGQMEENASE